MVKTHPCLSINAYGRVWVPHQPEFFFLNEIEEPLSFFREKRKAYTEEGWAADHTLFSFISADTTDNCNLRCKFCFDDFSKATSRKMTEEDFVKFTSMVELVPMVECSYRAFLSRSLIHGLSTFCNSRQSWAGVNVPLRQT